MAHSFRFRQDLTIPEVFGTKALDIGSYYCYLRWTFLSTHSLSKQQLRALIYEIKTTDGKLQIETKFTHTPPNEFKALLSGLEANKRYRFQIRCKLQHGPKVLFSRWSDRIEFTTKPSVLTILTDPHDLETASLRDQLLEYKARCDELEAQTKVLQSKLDEFLPKHLKWGHRQVVEWMMTIENGMLKPYQQTLLENVKREDVVGSILYQLNDNDLHRLGVSKMAHKKILMAHLNELTACDADLDLLANRKSSVLPTFDSQTDLSVSALDIVNGKHGRFALPSNVNSHSNRSSNSSGSDYETSDCPVMETMESIPDSLITRILDEPSVKTMGSVSSDDDDDEKKENDLYEIAGVTESVKKLLKSPSTSSPKHWKYSNGALTVVVEKATDIDNMDKPGIQNIGEKGWSDPYVQIELPGHYKKERTKVIESEENPVWNERFQLFPENPKRDVLKLTVWDKNKWVRDDFIGKVKIPLIDILHANGHIKRGFDIVGSQAGAKLYLELKYMEMGSSFISH